MQRVFKDPLFVFLIAGAAVFAGYRLADEADDPRHIRVDAHTLTAFVQHRSQINDPALARARLAGMTTEELGFIIDSYVREEALYREAVRLGFADGDYVMRRRLAQQAEFMAEGAASALPPLKEPDLRTYYERHRDDYAAPANLTFAHVYFDVSARGAGTARESAQQTLAELKARRADFNDAAGQGDSFLYHRNYVERSRRDLAGHFGDAMADALFDLKPGTWQGPLQSPYGLHLVFVAARAPGGPVAFEDARARVRTDAEQARRRAFANARVEEMVSAYRVTIEPLPNGNSLGGVARKKHTDPSRQSTASRLNPDR